ncbi:hypothetical protein WICPIJ_002031 [Wickerhamomyces pijperi]|uniref:Uncharacterized protein n=1 Tax=Wickerhamomyces pijperi TaxID=599730 RepID=A0A9P8TQL0_WICPI|nr:hypothetical protein WICPIJ_002031 [Wickerhamomyces pijperi]
MINNTWFHKHKYHDLIQESSGIDRIFAEFNDIIPMFYEPCLKDEFSQRMNSSETTGYTYHENFLQFNQYSNKTISEMYAYFKPAKKQSEPIFYDIEDVPREKYDKIRRLFNNVFYDVYLKDQQGELLKHLQVGYSSVLMYKHTQKCWLFGFMVNADHSHTEPNSFAAKATERCAYAISSYLTGDPMGLYLGKAPAT